jgi:putative YjhG/YagF family dehydratase
MFSSAEILDTDSSAFSSAVTHAAGPGGVLPITPEMLLQEPSGNLFGLSQNAGMGWEPQRLLDPEFLILSTHGGLRAADGTPIALGFHTGHWEVGLLVAEAAREMRNRHAIPFAGACTDPCDGRTQGTAGMLDSLAYRNDAAIVLRRLMRSLPTRKGVLGIATCDKGLPAMMMALASSGSYPSVLIPGGVTLLPDQGEDAGKVQTIGARFAQGQISLDYAAEMGCKACASPGGGCQFLGTAATSQVVAEALGLSLPHSALAPSGQALWLDAAVRSARALMQLTRLGIGTRDILTAAAIRNSMVVHAAFGGSTNLLLHIPAIAHAAGLPRPTMQQWVEVNREVPRLVDALPNGPRGHATVQVFLAGAVPEVMLHLRAAGLLDTSVRTVTGGTLDENLNWWEGSERRQALRDRLRHLDGIDPDDVIMSPDRARSRGLTATLCFASGNLAPEGSVVKSTSIDPSLIDADEVYRHTGPARVFLTEASAIDAIKQGNISHGDVVVLICGGPAGAGMQEIYQVTSAIKSLPFCKHVAVLTIGKLHEGDVLQIFIDRRALHGSIDLVGEVLAGETKRFTPDEGAKRLTARSPRQDLAPHPDLPDDTRLWAALTHVSGGVWGGCVYDTDAIVARLKLNEN